MRAVLRLLLGLAVVGFLGSFYLEGALAQRATFAQLVDRKPDGNTLRGKPVRILDVPAAAILAPGTATTPALVDPTALKPPIVLLDEIARLAHITRLGCLLACVITVFGLRRLHNLHLVAPDA